MKRNWPFIVAVVVGLVGLGLTTGGKSHADDHDGGQKEHVETVAEFQFIDQTGPLSPSLFLKRMVSIGSLLTLT